MNRGDFQTLALMRLEDAQSLLAAGRPSAAYYVGGYAVECALKACIASKTQLYDFPDKNAARHYTHNLNDLIGYAGLTQAFDAELLNPDFSANWNAVKEWREEFRYDSSVQVQKAQVFLDAIAGPNGVLPWVQQHW